MSKVVDIEKNQPHVASEVICVKCAKRWWAVRPVDCWLKDLECQACGHGHVIETGERVDKK